MKLNALLVIAIGVLWSAIGTAAPFSKDRCMVIYYAWNESDINSIGSDMSLYPGVAVLLKTDGTASVKGYPNPGTYTRSGKNLTLEFFDANAPATLIVTYSGRKKNSSKCFTSGDKNCWQGTMNPDQPAQPQGVWEGYKINKSFCQ